MKRSIWEKKWYFYLTFSYLLCQFLLIYFFVPNALGEIFFADPNIGIQSIINYASWGDTIIVKKGIYREGTIFLMDKISLIGDTKDLGSAVISGNSNGPVIWAADQTLIQNLVIRDGETGILCLDTTNITIDHNLILKNKIGIYIHSDNVNLTYNTIAHNEKNGILIDTNPNTPVITLENNVIASNGSSDYRSGIEFILYDSIDLKPVFLAYNDIYDNFYLTWWDAPQSPIPIVFTELFGPNNFSENPFFVDDNNENYHLLSISPCIDQADPNDDCSYEPEPNGGRCNLGFYGNTSQAVVTLDFDGDGAEDFWEGIGDMDGDALPDWQDSDTTIIPLPWGREKIALHIEDPRSDQNSQNISFSEAKTFPLSDLDIDTPSGFIPFGAVQFNVNDLKKGGTIDVVMVFPESYGALSATQYLVLSPNDMWSSIPFEVDPNKNAILFTIEDGAEGDKDGDPNGVIEHLSLIIIPQSEEWNPSKSCFISLISPYKHKQNMPYLSRLKKNSREKTALKLSIFLVLLFFPVCIKNNVNRRKNIDKIKNLFKDRIVLRFPFILVLLFCVFFRSNPIRAENPADMKMNASPNPIGSGARALGIGGAFIAVADDATAASWNPAALLKLKRPEMSVVGSYFSGGRNYDTTSIDGEIADVTDDTIHLNYFSVVYPFFFLRRNIILSLNYQQLYEFSLDTDYRWKDSILNMIKTSKKNQQGTLSSISPALAFQLFPSLYFGFTANFWLEDELNNQWENLNIIKGEGFEGEERIETYAKLYERYEFSGFNTHVGFLWRPNRWFALGGVMKTPFKAKIKRKWEFINIKEYPENPSRNNYYADSDCEDLTLEMPISYGLGISIHFSDIYLMSLDIYKTQWKDYLICFPTGRKYSPINNELEDKAGIKDTIQVRLGAEYLLIKKDNIIPFRFGLFYDPEPAIGKADDFYGASFGTGLILKGYAFDIGYQYRFGEKKEAEFIDNNGISAKINQSLVYTSVILYF